MMLFSNGNKFSWNNLENESDCWNLFQLWMQNKHWEKQLVLHQNWNKMECIGDVNWIMEEISISHEYSIPNSLPEYSGVTDNERVSHEMQHMLIGTWWIPYHHDMATLTSWQRYLIANNPNRCDLDIRMPLPLQITNNSVRESPSNGSYAKIIKWIAFPKNHAMKLLKSGWVTLDEWMVISQ